MRDEYNFSNGKRGLVIPRDPNKVRITIRLDTEAIKLKCVFWDTLQICSFNKSVSEYFLAESIISPRLTPRQKPVRILLSGAPTCLWHRLTNFTNSNQKSLILFWNHQRNRAEINSRLRHKIITPGCTLKILITLL